VVLLLDARSAKLVDRLTHNDGDTLWVDIQGNRLASSSRGLVRLWDVTTRKALPVLEPIPAIHRVAVSPDGKWVACAPADSWSQQLSHVYILDSATGKVRWTLPGHKWRVWAVAFSPDGSRLATTDSDGKVRVWQRTSTVKSPPALVADRLEQLLSSLLRSDRTDAQIVEALYLATLGRLPTEAEQKKAFDHVRTRKERSSAFVDLLFVLTHTHEYRSHVQDLSRRVGS
jgi:WD40 repeat protein